MSSWRFAIVTYPFAFCILNTSMFRAAASKIPCISCDGETSRTTTMHPSFRGNYSSVSLSLVAGIFSLRDSCSTKAEEVSGVRDLIKGNARNVAGFSRRFSFLSVSGQRRDDKYLTFYWSLQTYHHEVPFLFSLRPGFFVANHQGCAKDLW